jgi:hypothetical protein
MQRDPEAYKDGMNTYQYASSNPANLTDAQGLGSFSRGALSLKMVRTRTNVTTTGYDFLVEFDVILPGEEDVLLQRVNYSTTFYDKDNKQTRRITAAQGAQGYYEFWASGRPAAEYRDGQVLTLPNPPMQTGECKLVHERWISVEYGQVFLTGVGSHVPSDHPGGTELIDPLLPVEKIRDRTKPYVVGSILNFKGSVLAQTITSLLAYHTVYTLWAPGPGEQGPAMARLKIEVVGTPIPGVDARLNYP